MSVIGQIKNIKRQLTDAHIEVVCHANALGLLTKSESKETEEIKELSSMNVQFIACENTMARKQIIKTDLLPEIDAVPSRLVEIVLQQKKDGRT